MLLLKRMVLLSAVALVAFGLTACERKITRIELASGPLTCADCHNTSTLITGKETEWAESLHGTGTAYLRATSAGCAGCHSGGAFATMIAAGQNPSQVTAGDPDPTRQDCRACHMIHSTYTMQDFALRTNKAVTLYAITNPTTFNGGDGNLCANCHQPRGDAPVPVNGTISGISSHWGLHHGPQSAMILGVGGAGITGPVAGHYGAVQNTCVTCHMGMGMDHHFEPAVATCVGCHPGAKNFDVDGVQTEIAALGDSLGQMLFTAGLITANSADGAPKVTSAPQAQGQALWNWIYVMHDDGSMGVHNTDYARALLQKGIQQMAASPSNGGAVARR